MAAAAVLQPSSNLEMSSLPSISDMSQARQRRKRSTRKTEGFVKPKRQSVQVGEAHVLVLYLMLQLAKMSCTYAYLLFSSRMSQYRVVKTQNNPLAK